MTSKETNRERPPTPFFLAAVNRTHLPLRPLCRVCPSHAPPFLLSSHLAAPPSASRRRFRSRRMPARVLPPALQLLASPTPRDCLVAAPFPSFPAYARGLVPPLPSILARIRGPSPFPLAGQTPPRARISSRAHLKATRSRWPETGESKGAGSEGRGAGGGAARRTRQEEAEGRRGRRELGRCKGEQVQEREGREQRGCATGTRRERGRKHEERRQGERVEGRGTWSVGRHTGKGADQEGGGPGRGRTGRNDRRMPVRVWIRSEKARPAPATEGRRCRSCRDSTPS